MDDLKEARGTFNCPHCGKTTPHPHTPEQIAWLKALPQRLEALTAELHCGFYTAMHRVYGTDYSQKAEKALADDLQPASAFARATLSDSSAE